MSQLAGAITAFQVHGDPSHTRYKYDWVKADVEVFLRLVCEGWEPRHGVINTLLSIPRPKVVQVFLGRLANDLPPGKGLRKENLRMVQDGEVEARDPEHLRAKGARG
jgi:hypothetical protein